DSGSFGSCNAAQSYPGLAEGSHSLQVRATAGGQTDASPASSSWTVDTIAPTLALGAKPNTYANSTSAHFGLNITDATPTSPTCKLDAGSTVPCTSTSSQDYTGLSEGVHTVTVNATDSAGNAAPPVSYSWHVDVTAPHTSIDSAPGNPSPSDVAFTFSSNEL